MVYTAPTSAGKSLVADASCSATSAPGDAFALAIFPFVDLCNERSAHMYARAGKEFRLKRLYGGRGGGAFKRWRKRTIVVCTPSTNSIISQLLELGRLGNCAASWRTRFAWCAMGGGASHRAPVDENSVRRSKGLTKAQIVCMSAPMREESLEAIATWLGSARTYSTSFAPSDSAWK